MAWRTFKRHLSSLQTNPVLIQLVQVQSVPFNCKSGWYSHGRDKQGMYKKKATLTVMKERVVVGGTAYKKKDICS